MHKLGRLSAYGVIGLTSSSLIGGEHGFRSGFWSGMGLAIAVGAIPIITSKIFGEKEKTKGKTGLIISLDSLVGELCFPATLVTASILSKFVHNTVTGFVVGLSAAFVSYVVGAAGYYLLWGITNIKKYRKTGFGSISEFKSAFKEHFHETILAIPILLQKKKNTENKEKNQENLPAESFMKEVGEMHAKGFICASPYYIMRIVAGVLAGFAPGVFVESFTAILLTVSPYITPVYINFYGLVEARANSTISTPKKE